MTRSLSFQAVMLTTVAFGALGADAQVANAAGYAQTDLVSDVSGLATITDPNLKNSWGVSFMPGMSPFWISDQGKGTASLFNVTGSTGVSPANNFPNPPGANTNFVAIPAGPNVGPTGQVANTNTGAFDVGNGGNGKSAAFIFANLNGTIDAWNKGNVNSATQNAASVEATTPGATYTGLAINGADTMLYAANGAGAGSIQVFNSSFTNVTTPSEFVDPNLPAGLVPFNVEDIGGKVYVAYAPAGHVPQTAATAGMGAVAVFGEDGTFQTQLVSGGQLASPWGMAIAPAGFGPFGGDLLVGNFAFGDSEINAFDATTGTFEGKIPVNPGGNMPGGLWTLAFGGGGNDGSPNTLFFTDGINSEGDGLFGSITAVPEPSTWAMMLVGFGGLAFFAARRRTALAVG